MNTLTGIEAERVSQILRHAIDRLHILSYVPTQWDDDLAEGIDQDNFVTAIDDQTIFYYSILTTFRDGNESMT
jgi:hypothetical protein